MDCVVGEISDGTWPGNPFDQGRHFAYFAPAFD